MCNHMGRKEVLAKRKEVDSQRGPWYLGTQLAVLRVVMRFISVIQIKHLQTKQILHTHTGTCYSPYYGFDHMHESCMQISSGR
jgi:hypothetical protein